jgi:hypothetical protein
MERKKKKNCKKVIKKIKNYLYTGCRPAYVRGGALGLGLVGASPKKAPEKGKKRAGRVGEREREREEDSRSTTNACAISFLEIGF